MATINYHDLFTGQTKLDFGEFVSLVKGASITSLATADNFLEFGLSDGYILRIDSQNNVNLFQYLKILPVRINLITNDETPTAQLVELRLHALRQIYAINCLVNAGKEDDIANAFRTDSAFDLEDLIDTANKLFVISASPGSFWLTVTTRTMAALKNFGNIFPLFYDEGRQAVLERVRANTDLAKLDVDKKRSDIQIQRASGLIDLYIKIEKIKIRLRKNASRPS
jgi:hypothetical protein